MGRRVLLSPHFGVSDSCSFHLLAAETSMHPALLITISLVSHRELLLTLSPFMRDTF